MLRLPQMEAARYDPVQMGGGLDQVTSAYQLSPGALRECLNFACRPQGGYYRIPGYERFDGRPMPHRAEFVPVAVTLLPGKSIAVGDSGTFGNLTGTVSFVDPFENYIGLTKTTSLATPIVPGNVVIGGDIKGTATGYYSGLDIKTIAINKAAAANIYRADIGAVPGSGPIRGVVYHNDTAYAFRDNAGATACEIYKSSAAGWTSVPLGQIINFTAMTGLPAEGTTLTAGGVTATVRRTAITSGDTGTGTGAGYMVIDTVVGGPFAAGAATFTGGGATLAGAQSQITLLPGGDYSFDLERFSAGGASQRIYGADGVNDAFEFDGEVYVPIPIATTAKPKYVQGHADHLFLMVESSMIHSGIGRPFNYEVISGAGEIALKGVGTGMLVLPGNQGTAALGAFTDDSTWILYGTSSADWKLVNFNLGIGAKHGSLQNLFDAFAFDDRGGTMMKASLNYGNFDAGRITYNIRPFVQSQRGQKISSSINRENGQYRVFFASGYGIYTTTKSDGIVGHGVVLYPHPVRCTFDGTNSDGTAFSLFGTDDGYVMLNDVGTSFDGQKINGYINTNINCAKSPRMRKRFRRLVLEMQGDGYVDMRVGYSFDWASADILPHLFVDGDAAFSSHPAWDSLIWDAFYWDGKSDDSISVELSGTGENLQTILTVDSDYVAEFTVPSAIFHYTPRRGNR